MATALFAIITPAVGKAEVLQVVTFGNRDQFELLETVNDKLIFVGPGPDGRELYATDGRSVTQLADINPDGDAFSRSLHRNFTETTVFNDELFFVGLGPSGRELYKTDGNTVTQLPDLNPDNYAFGESEYHFLTVFNDELFFTANGPDGKELYATDGNTVTQLADINPDGDAFVSFPAFATFSGSLYFTARGENTFGLFRTDGTTVNQLSDLNTPANFSVFNGQLVFTSGSHREGYRLYKTDGTNVEQISDIEFENVSPFTHYKDQLFFRAVGPDGRELYATDGTSVTQLADINPDGDAFSDLATFEIFNDLLFFVAEGPQGEELYKTDGTSVTQLADINPDGDAFQVSPQFTVVGGELFFTALGPDGTAPCIRSPPY